MITKFRNLIIICLVILVAGCNSGTDDLDNRQGSQNPFGAQIIVIDSNDNVVYGNLTDLIEVVINVNEQLNPDGTLVDFQFSSTDLPINHRGCVLGGDNSTSNGQAVLDLLAGLFIDESPNTMDEPPAFVNVGVTLTRAGGQQESRSFPIAVNPVRLISPPDTEITTNPVGAPTTLFITLQFMTQGIPVGTIVEFEASNTAIGDVEESMGTVQGTKAEGQAIVQYTTVNGTGGTQVITATIVLPDPATMDPDCPSIPEVQRTLQEVVVIDQSAPDEEPEPEPEMMCDDGIDNDGDGPIDCADADCTGVAAGPMGQLCGPENNVDRCSDGFDNDGDGLEDCADTDCDMLVVGPMGQICAMESDATTCSDDFDNDNDGTTDCGDATCGGVDTPAGTCEFFTEVTCDDGFDNDGDGDIDGADSDCP